MGDTFFSNDDFDFSNDSTATPDDADIWALAEDGDFEFDSIHIESFDSDMDGINDTVLEEIDIDGDGYTDTVSIVSDTDGDGYYDISVESQDTNLDGIVDSFTIMQDTNGDGIIDYAETQVDMDFDGVVDYAVIEEDLNFDGVTDSAETMIASENGEAYFMRAADLDFDGDIDEYDITKGENPFSSDGTEYYEENDEYVVPDTPEAPEEPDITPYDEDTDYTDDFDEFEEDDETPYIDLEELDYDESNSNGKFAYELDNYDPSTADPDSIIGNPDAVLDLWESQGDTGRCAIYAQKFVIEEYTGEEIDIEDLVDLATENGWFTEEGGTPTIHMDKILDYYNVPNETSSGNDINDIIESLNEGHKVIVSVDADEYWFGENEDVYIPGDGVNHAVEVIGIDNSDPENPLVILNDSGNPDGCGSMVPLDTFMDAWEDGNCYMVECM